MAAPISKTHKHVDGCQGIHHSRAGIFRSICQIGQVDHAARDVVHLLILELEPEAVHVLWRMASKCMGISKGHAPGSATLVLHGKQCIRVINMRAHRGRLWPLRLLAPWLRTIFKIF
eukprot:1159406-Pelagomonas_calceolata.AAC.9